MPMAPAATAVTGARCGTAMIVAMVSMCRFDRTTGRRRQRVRSVVGVTKVAGRRYFRLPAGIGVTVTGQPVAGERWILGEVLLAVAGG